MSNYIKPQSYKILLIGAGGVGKTSYVSRLFNYLFEIQYKTTVGAHVQTLSVNTNIGRLYLTIWDCAGQEQYIGVKEPQYRDAHGCIVMADDRIETQDKINIKIKDVKKILGDIPITKIINKVDVKYPETLEKDTFYISVKKHIDIYSPLLDILRKITGDNKLMLI
jgi:GTP-binding nuclear protein Ran